MKECESLVSVVVPVYNVERYLSRCLESIIHQEYKNMEIILVDDGATDYCGDICEAYARKDKRIRVIHKENGGLSSARNTGISVASGKYIVFIDSDDYVHRSHVGTLEKMIREENAEIAMAGYLKGKRNKFPRVKSRYAQQTLSSEELLRQWHSKLKKIETTACGKIYLRELFVKNKIEYPDGRIWEDVMTTHRLVSKAKKIVVTEYPLYYYYKRKGSITSFLSGKKIQDICIAQEERMDFFKKNGYRKAYERLLIKYQKYLMLTYCQIQSKKLEKYKNILLDKFFHNYLRTVRTKSIKRRERCLFWIFSRFYDWFDWGFRIIRKREYDED